MCFTYVASTYSRCFISLRCMLHSSFILHMFQVVLRARGHREVESGEPVHMACGMLGGVDAKLMCKHKGLIPDSNVKAC